MKAAQLPHKRSHPRRFVSIGYGMNLARRRRHSHDGQLYYVWRNECRIECPPIQMLSISSRGKGTTFEDNIITGTRG